MEQGDSASAFANDFRGALNRLRKLDKDLADNQDLLRALLYQAILSDDHDEVKKSILKDDDIDPQKVLSELCSEERIIQEKDGATNESLSSRRTGTYTSGGGTKPKDFRDSKPQGAWNMAPIPYSWKQWIGIYSWNIEVPSMAPR